MGRTEWGTYSNTWRAPDYEVDDNGKVVGIECERQPNNWGRWGELDERGTTNFITPEKVADAARLIRDGKIITEDLAIETLRRVKEDAKEVKAGLECGIKLAGYDDIKVGDRLEAYIREKHERTL